MKKALIAIDYNRCAQKVAETGYAFAKAMNAEVYILHAVADASYYSADYAPIMGFEGIEPDYAFNNLKEQEKEGKRFLEAVVKHLGDDKIKTVIVDGKTDEAILKYAAENNADFIVMGSQSHSGIEKMLMGSVAARILKHTHIPVLIIPTDKQAVKDKEYVKGLGIH